MLNRFGSPMISCVGGTSGAESESSCLRVFVPSCFRKPALTRLCIIRAKLRIEEELDDVGVLDGVILPFGSYQTQAIQLLKTTVLTQVLKRSHMSSDEALLHV